MEIRIVTEQEEGWHPATGEPDGTVMVVDNLARDGKWIARRTRVFHIDGSLLDEFTDGPWNEIIAELAE